MDLKETLELLNALQNLADEVKADSEDGKLTILEILGNYPDILEVIEEGKDYQTVIAELKDLDQAEILTLVEKLIALSSSRVSFKSIFTSFYFSISTCCSVFINCISVNWFIFIQNRMNATSIIIITITATSKE